MTRRNVTDEQFGQLCRRAGEMLRRVDEGTVNFDTAMNVLQKVIEGKLTDFLKLIPDTESLIIDSVDEDEILANATDVFDYIDPDFKKYDVNEKGPATEEMPIHIYEMIRSATFSEMFSSFSFNLRQLCFTQAQIKNFVKKYRHWLSVDSHNTFFLFNSNGQFFVAKTLIDSGGALRLLVDRFEDVCIWRGDLYTHRVVVPQLV